jgi:hypothetical protein
VSVLVLGVRLPAANLSPYDFGIPTADVAPTEAAAARIIAEIEASYPRADLVQRAIDRWYVVD